MVVGIFLFTTPGQILNKVQSFSHGEYNNGELDRKKFEEK